MSIIGTRIEEMFPFLKETKEVEIEETIQFVNEDVKYLDNGIFPIIESVVIRIPDNNITINVDGPGRTVRNFLTKPYFKVRWDNDKLCRVEFLDGNLVVGHGTNDRVPAKVKVKVNKALRSIDPETNLSGWEMVKDMAIKKGLENASHLSKETKNEFVEKINNEPCPNMLKLKVK